jgi:hypothetical protein
MVLLKMSPLEKIKLKLPPEKLLLDSDKTPSKNSITPENKLDNSDLLMNNLNKKKLKE